ncbi:uncharacterized protein ALTATR162_LOCUS7008 [Alternaria atra]|uniref:Uncharacterized protein n=1 Tax=Alternaria atra TaxID=119953 RepID=A0A8J2I3I7_9PLEO|nr:uncharacterized protein ALTATR162_LOCUS7008 [Alternaria atra]CAG5169156.1 unnamed protein product [Alternaria atra]
MNNAENLKTEDCESLHLFSALTSFFALGSPKSGYKSLVIGESVIPDWLSMLRSSEPLLSILNPANYDGPLVPLFTFGRQQWQILHGASRPHSKTLLQDLQALVNSSCTEPELLPIYNNTIELLRRVLSLVILNSVDSEDYGNDGAASNPLPSSTSYPTPRLEAWDALLLLWEVSGDFIPLLKAPVPRQEAVVIYAHFLILIKKLEQSWWLEGWATHMMERVWLSLDHQHRMWIQWAVEEIGWIPP